MRVAITGATGLVGRALTRRLLSRGDSVLALTRDPERARACLPTGVEAVRFTVGSPGDLAPFLAGVDGVVNLAGEPVLGRRWSAVVMEEIRVSRLSGTRTVVEAIRLADAGPRVLVNASAVGYYGPRGEEEVDEETPPGDDFLARLCVDWEAEAARAGEFGIRWAAIRIGIALSAEGGALPRMTKPYRFFLGGPIGRGRQGFPWIHIEDLAGIFLLALDRDDLRGPVNGCAPTPPSNREFGKALGRALHRPSWLPVPRPALRLIVGKAARVLVTGQRAVPRRVIEAGFAFRFPEVTAALADLLDGGRQG